MEKKRSTKERKATMGLIEQTKLDHFNLPYYAPAPEEVRHETEACFRIQQFDIFYVDWDANFLVIKMVAQGKVLLIIDMQEARVLPRVYEQWRVYASKPFRK
ncbi:hypothetical protein ACOSP7_005609 [Xanthoceras sorbifolium]